MNGSHPRPLHGIRKQMNQRVGIMFAPSISRNLADTIVTEYGVAELRGRSIRERADALIAIAHPDFRAELREGARKLGYL